MTVATPSRRLAALRILFLVLSAALIVRILVGADLARVGGILAHLGPAVLLALLPYLAAISVDMFGWRLLLQVLSHRPPLLALLRLRLATEAVLPAGPLAAESFKVFMLERRLGVPLAHGVASVGAKKSLLTLALALFLAASAVGGWRHLNAASPMLIGGRGLPMLILAVAAGLALAAGLGFALLRRGAMAARLHRLLSRLPWRPARAWLSARERGFTEVDRAFAPLAAARGRLVLATAAFVAGWTVEMLDSFVLLKLLGAQVSLAQLFALEASVAFIRSLAVLVPGGFGLQDVGYLVFFRAFGVPDAVDVGAVFLVLRRAKDLVWLALGYLVLVADRAPRAAAQPAS